jgi:hypothetical protein
MDSDFLMVTACVALVVAGIAYLQNWAQTLPEIDDAEIERRLSRLAAE